LQREKFHHQHLPNTGLKDMIKSQTDYFRRIRCASAVAMLLIGFWSIALPVLHAQNAPFSTLWSQLEAKTDQPDVDTTYQFIFEDAKAYCGGDRHG